MVELKLLIANRGEIANRIAQTASTFPISNPCGFSGEGEDPSQVTLRTVGLYTRSERHALHVQNCDSAVELHPAAGSTNEGSGFLDAEQIIKIAREQGCWAIIPGYGFLSESPIFAKLLEADGSGIVFVGPTSEQLDLFGDKIKAKQLARECGVPLLPGTLGPSASLAEVLNFVKSLPAGQKAILKAVAGGGGRGMRIIEAMAGTTVEETVRHAYESCSREASTSFGDARIYVERYLSGAKHIEVQIVGDGTGDVCHLWDRECSVQRRHQKLIEIAPAPGLHAEVRRRVISYATKMAASRRYRSLGTFEFLVLPETGEAFLLEVNPRIQVEHTVTEQVNKLDLVAIQLSIALGSTLRDLGLSKPVPFPLLTSIQLRINAEVFQADGNTFPASGTLTKFAPPTGPAYRIDTHAHSPFHLKSGQKVEFTSHPSFDSLLAKLITTAPSYEAAVEMSRRGLEHLQVEGCETNASLLLALLDTAELRMNKGVQLHTAFVQQNAQMLFDRAASRRSSASSSHQVVSNDTPLKVEGAQAPEGTDPIRVPMAGVVVSVDVKEGDQVQAGQQVAVLEAMKMEHLIRASHSGAVKKIAAIAGDIIQMNMPIAFITKGATNAGADEGNFAELAKQVNLDEIRPELQSVMDRKKLLQDEGREAAVEKRHSVGYLTARENLAQLVDEGSFIELGDFAMAAQRSRIDVEELKRKTSGDGVITGWATVNSKKSGIYPSPWRTAICIYDYLVLAGTQGHFHHVKLDRLFNSVLNNPAPLVLYAEGGGGRPGDTDLSGIKVGGLDTPSFSLLASIRASGILSIGVANGYVFAGNAALLGTCDLIVATRGGNKSRGGKAGKTSIGMGGPAMIAGGGLGEYAPQDVGPVESHLANGGIDLLVDTEVEATLATKKILSYFQPVPSFLELTSSIHCADQRLLRHLLPRDRKRAYDVKTVLTALADEDSFLEVGANWGHSLITGLLRIDGQPLAVVASSVLSPLGGAIDASSAIKATRLTQLITRTKALHLLVLCDTPGFMVGPEAEKQGGLRIFADWFAACRSFEMSGGRIFGVTLRKGYGLGAQGLLGGSTISNFFGISWPTGEFAGMGIEGAVRLGMRKELEAVPEGPERDELYKAFVDEMYERGKAESAASVLEIDSVIDPAETRSWVQKGLASVPARIPTWLEAPTRNNSARL